MSEPRCSPAPGQSVTAQAAWGAGEIRLVADRVASLRTGSTHKVYRGWRFEATIPAGPDEPGARVLTVPVDPTDLAASHSRYALAQLANQGVIAEGRPAAFSWSASCIGTADPFAAALALAHRRLAAAGWTPDAADPTHFAKTDPTVPGGEAAAMSSAATAAHDAIFGGAAAHPAPPFAWPRRRRPK